MAVPTVSCVTDSSPSAFLLALRTAQAQARYPALLEGLHSKSLLTAPHRAGSGLVTVAVEQGRLGEAERMALGAFRLHQYLLCRWYDLQRVSTDQVEYDPQLGHLPASTIHIFSGTAEGHLLAYACLQGANALTTSEAALMDYQATLVLTDTPRPLFASERELFGPACFASLPALRSIPLAALGELNCFLCNQALRSPQSTIAGVETLLLMTQCILRPEAGLQAILGASDQEARGLLGTLEFPMLYAPHAPVVVPFLPYKHYWAAGEVGTAAQGKYWPFVVASADLRAQHAHIDRLNTLLDQSPATIRRGLVQLRKQAQAVRPSALMPPRKTKAARMWKASSAA